MLVLTKILCNTIMCLFGFLILKRILGKDNIKWDFKNTLLIILAGSIISLFTFTKYTVISPIMSYVIFTIIYKIIFRISLIESILISGVFLVLIFAADLILLPFNFILFQNRENRTEPIIMIMLNFIIAIIAYLISKISMINNMYVRMMKVLHNIKMEKIIVFTILTILVMTIIFSVLGNTYDVTSETIISLITVGIFIILFILYSKEQEEYNNLIVRYDQLLNYVTQFEAWIDNQEMSKHEYKNDLAMLQTKVKDKEVKKFIENKLTKKLIVEDDWIKQLKSMPDGGMKGLLYYKIILAKNNKVNLKIDVSNSIKKKFSDIKKKDYKIICQLFGIYLDNALEGSINSKKKSMSVEIYELQNELNIVISNSFKGKINLSKLNEKGYTTKGNGHGKGLHFAEELLKLSDNIEANHIICNDFYIQRLKIKQAKNKK